MSGELGSDGVDLTAPGDVVSAMAAAIGRLRQLAAAAFSSGSGGAGDGEAARPERIA